MPLPATAQLSRPKSEDEFEDMVLDALRIRWKAPDASRNGRRGQRQNGVDIFGRPAEFDGRWAGAQCKNVLASPFTIENIRDAAAKAEGFEPTLAKFYVVVSLDRDVRLQEGVRLLCEERKREGKFSVDLLFWNDVSGLLADDTALVEKYWPSGRPKAGSVVLQNVDLAGGDGGRGTDAAGGGADVAGGTGYSGASGGDAVVVGGSIRGGNAGSGGPGGSVSIKGGDAK